MTFKTAESPPDKSLDETSFPDSLETKVINSVHSGHLQCQSVTVDIKDSIEDSPRKQNGVCHPVSDTKSHSSIQSSDSTNVDLFLPSTVNQRKMSQLPKRMPVNLEFSELTYCVEAGGKKSKLEIFFRFISITEIC